MRRAAPPRLAIPRPTLTTVGGVYLTAGAVIRLLRHAADARPAWCRRVVWTQMRFVNDEGALFAIDAYVVT